MLCGLCPLICSYFDHSFSRGEDFRFVACNSQKADDSATVQVTGGSYACPSMNSFYSEGENSLS